MKPARVSVLVTLDVPAGTLREDIEKHMLSKAIRRPDGSVVGYIGFAAIPNSTHELARALLGEDDRRLS